MFLCGLGGLVFCDFAYLWCGVLEVILVFGGGLVEFAGLWYRFSFVWIS